MSKLAEAVRDFLNEDCDISTSELYYEVFSNYDISDGYRELLEFEFEGRMINIADFELSANHIDGDGGDIGIWVTIEDDGKTYHVGKKGTYSSWGDTEFYGKFRIGKVKTWTESMFE